VKYTVHLKFMEKKNILPRETCKQPSGPSDTGGKYSDLGNLQTTVRTVRRR